ncbi:M20 metallopeptidase family protein [Enteractinococcus fodinae]|uniref:Hippurate hydrolase n=1 Tax=Enteractinococcus fodinae TaxID=684663 RepID=A0ABU2B4U5_9MICC|nr:M20 family metallopeptidase [Enteractinococcus fodinae]MDR7348416.1 hippurate hydrolase [Enteractinococcus fodinae]
MSLHAEALQLQPHLVNLRRSLHTEPEVGLNLPKTQRKVLNALEGLPLEITLGEQLSSVVATLHGAHEGPSVLLRGDMDGLPLQEKTGLPYASSNGNMHACGHDLHTAGLVGAAKLLSGYRSKLHGSVIFMFQPGEESYGGAKLMIEEGVLEAAGAPPIAAYGIHVSPGPKGTFVHRAGPALAGSNQLSIKVHGKGGHGSRPENAVDPVPALVKIAGSLGEMIASKFSPFDPVVLTVTQLKAGQAINIIPETAELGATVRTFSAEAIELLRHHTSTFAAGIASSFGCTAEVELQVRYPVTMNDPFETSEVAHTLENLFGPNRVLQAPEPGMGSEDFSEILKRVPGSFFFLRASPPDVDHQTSAWNHSPEVLFDDGVLGDQALALASLALNKLGQPHTLKPNARQHLIR